MLVAGLVGVVVVAVVFILLFAIARSLSDPYQRYFAYFFLFSSSIELIVLFWVLVYVAISDWTLWSLSMNDFWREQLSAIYFIKEWLYTWVWNDLLDFFLVFLPAALFLAVRTTLTSYLGLWTLAASRKRG